MIAQEKKANTKQKADDLRNKCEKEKEKEKQEPQKPLDIPKVPEQTQKDDKSKIYQCICRCGIPSGVWGGYYPDSIPNSSPSCEKPGICAAGNWGCYRFYPPTEGSCFELCFKSAGIKQDEIKKEIKKVMEKDYNDLINKAREIMEEYLIEKKGSSSFWKKEELFALSFQGLLSDGKGIYDSGTDNSYLRKIKEKNKRGDPDIALKLVEEAENIFPERKKAGNLANLRAEFAIILAKAALNILPELEFDEGIYMLEKALKIYNYKDNTIIMEIKGLHSSFMKMKSAWKIVEEETPKCLNFIEKKDICLCEDLYKARIYPSLNSLNIFVYSSSDKWRISSISSLPVKIPKKEKVEKKLKDALQNGKIECEKNPILNSKDMKDLKNYYSYKQYEYSKYTDKENLTKYAAKPLCGVNALKIAKKILSNPDLCDCQKKELEKIIEIAKKDREPMSVEFDANPKEIKLNERVLIELKIKGGTPPFDYTLKGSLNLNSNKELSRGFVLNWKPDKAGAHTFKITVMDSCGEIFEKDVRVNAKGIEEIKKEEKNLKKYRIRKK